MDTKMMVDVIANTRDYKQGMLECARASQKIDEDIRVKVTADTGLASSLMARFREDARSVPNKVNTKVDVDGDNKAILLTKALLKSLKNKTRLDIEVDSDLDEVITMRDALKSLKNKTKLDIEVDNDLDEVYEMDKALDSLPNKTKASIEVDGDLDEVEVMAQALRNLPNRVSSSFEFKGDMDEIMATDMAMDALPNRISTSHDLKTDRGAFSSLWTALKAIPNRIHTEHDLDSDMASVATTQAVLRSIPNSIHTKHTIDTDVSMFDRIKSKFTEIRLSMAEASNDSKRFRDGMSSSISSVAQSVDSLGSRFGLMQSLLLIGIPTLIPVIASLVPAIMAVGNAIGVVAGGAVGLGGAFAIGAGGVGAFALMAMEALTMMDEGLFKGVASVTAYNDSMDALGDKWREIITLNVDGIFTTMTNAINAGQLALTKVTPALSGVVGLLSQASGNMMAWVQTSPVAQAFFNMLNSTGVKVFGDLLSGAGHLSNGIVNMFTQFAPLFDFVSEGFDNMMAHFSAWTSSVQGSQAIQGFVEYVKVNLPVIGAIFGNTFDGIFNLFKAFSPNSQTIFSALEQMTQRFVEWSASIQSSDGFQKFIAYTEQNGPVLLSTLGKITTAFIDFSTALAPLSADVLGMIGRLAELTSQFISNHPNVVKVAGAIGMLSGVIGLVTPPLKVLITSFRTMWGVANILRGGIQVLIPVLGALSSPIGIVIAVGAGLTALFVTLYKNSETFRNGVDALWGRLKQLGSVMADFGKKTLDSVGGMFSGLTTIVWDNIKKVPEIISKGLGSAVDFVGGLHKNMRSKGQDFVTGFVNGVIETTDKAIKAVYDMAKGSIDTVKKFLKIGSPSKVMKQIGEWTPEGYAIGVNNGLGFVESAMGKFTKTVNGGMQQLMSAKFDTASSGSDSLTSALVSMFSDNNTALNDAIKKRESYADAMASANKDLENIAFRKRQTQEGKNFKGLEKRHALENFARETEEAKRKLANAREGFNKEVSKIGQISKEQTKLENLNAVIRPMQNAMLGIAKQRDAVLEKLESAKDRLKNAMSMRDEFKQSVKDTLNGFSALSSANRVTSQGMKRVMEARLKNMKEFQNNIRRLQAMGLNEGAIKDILSAGVENGGRIANGLVQGGAQAVKEMNGIQSSMQAISSQVAQETSNQFYQAGVNTAKGMVNGLMAQERALENQAIRMGNVIAGAIRKALGIHSPSRVAMDIMGYFGQGGVKGLESQYSSLKRASLQVADIITKYSQPSDIRVEASAGTDIRRTAQNQVAQLESTISASPIDADKQTVVYIKADPNMIKFTEEVNNLNGRRNRTTLFNV